MKSKLARNEMEQTEMGNAKHAKIIPGPKRQALPLLNSDFLFLLSPSASSASPLPFPFRSSLRYHPPVHPLFLPSPISYHLLHCSLLREDVITSTTTMATWWRLLHTSQHAASWKLSPTSNEKNSYSPGSSRSKERW